MIVGALMFAAAAVPPRSALQVGDMVGTWDVVVDGASALRFLEITQVRTVTAAEATLEARYGLAGNRGRTISVTARVAGDAIERISFVTQADSRVEVVTMSPVRLSGRFTPAKGDPHPVTLWRRRATHDGTPSGLVGKWEGVWQVQGHTTISFSLEVPYADATAASFQYRWDAAILANGTSIPPGQFWGTGEVDRSGRFTFWRRGVLWTFKQSGEYLGGVEAGGGYTNSAVLRRVTAQPR
jgi:hypothetical protein